MISASRKLKKTPGDKVNHLVGDSLQGHDGNTPTQNAATSLYQVARAAITKYHRLGGWHNKN